ncbi:hypothetical protein I4U23_022784 [Adineta vaga]|nr:hypothetical protein I4U23_022784 [Adineta vaga]
MFSSLFLEPLDRLQNMVWVNAQDGEIPSFSVAGGQEGNRSVYVARVTISNNIIPGKLVAGEKSVKAEYWGANAISRYQILTNPDSKLKFVWVSTCASKLPSCALVAGREGEIARYVGRIFLCSDAILIGKYNGPNGPLHYVRHGEKQSTEKNIQVLCVF